MGYKQESNGSLRSKAAPLQWGSQHESVARERYVKFMKKKGHKRLTVMERGLIVQSDLPFLGASPDGFVYCPGCREYQRLLEIKCPYKWRLLTPRVAAQDKKKLLHQLKGKGKTQENINLRVLLSNSGSNGSLQTKDMRLCDIDT